MRAALSDDVERDLTVRAVLILGKALATECCKGQGWSHAWPKLRPAWVLVQESRLPHCLTLKHFKDA